MKRGLFLATLLCAVIGLSQGQYFEKEIGIACTFDVDCQVLYNTECRSNTCQCKPRYVVHENNKSCVQEASLGGDCVLDIQCPKTPLTSSCRFNKCVLCNDTSADQHLTCADPYGCALHAYGNKCWKNRKIGDPCAASEECYLYPSSDSSTHCDRVCSCRPGFDYRSLDDSVGVDKCRSSTGGGASGLPLNAWGVLTASAISALFALSISR